MLTLAIDTSSESFTVALVRGETAEGAQILDEETHSQAKRHLIDLFGVIESMLARQSLGTGQLQHIAVTTGPGSFTGVRLGVLVARTLAQVHGCLLSEVQSSEALVLAVQRAGFLLPPGRPVWLVMDVRKGQVLCGLVNFAQTTLALELLSAPDWISRISTPACLFGSAQKRYAAELGPEHVWLGEEFQTVRASNVALLGLEIIRSGKGTTWKQLLPSYVRPPDAVPLSEQQSRKKGS